MDNKTVKGFFIGFIVGLVLSFLLVSALNNRYKLERNGFMKIDTWTGKTYTLDTSHKPMRWEPVDN